MPKQKYNYEKLQLEFFKSNFDEVKAFITDKGLIYNSERTKRTKGRAKEKKEYNAMIVDKALKDNIKKQAENLEIPTEQLLKAKKTVIGLLMKKLQESIEKGNINVGEQEKILRMIKTELGEPTNISKTDATIKSEPIDENLLIKD